MRRIITFIFAFFSVTAVSAQHAFEDYVCYDGVPGFCNSKYYTYSEEKTFEAKAVLAATVSPAVGNVRLSTASVPAQLYILPDPEAVYDRSYKIYAMEFGGYKVEYTVYANADKLMVGYGGKEYWFDCINGACDVYIKNLSHQYINYDNGEELILLVTNNFPMMALDGTTITLKKGSKFRFRVYE